VQWKLLFRKQLTPSKEILQWAYAVTLLWTSWVTVTSNEIKTNYPMLVLHQKLSHQLPGFIQTQNYLTIYLC